MHPYTGETDLLRAILTAPEYMIGKQLKVSDNNYKLLKEGQVEAYTNSTCAGLDAYRFFLGMFCPSLTDEAGLNLDLLPLLTHVQQARQPSWSFNCWSNRVASTKPTGVDNYPGIRFITDRLKETLKIRVHPEIPPYSDLMQRVFHPSRTRGKKNEHVGKQDDTLMPAILNTAMCFKALGLEQPFEITDVALKMNSKGVEVVCIPRKVRSRVTDVLAGTNAR